MLPWASTICIPGPDTHLLHTLACALTKHKSPPYAVKRDPIARVVDAVDIISNAPKRPAAVY